MTEYDPPKLAALEPNRYEYMSKEDSALWDRIDTLSAEEAKAELRKALLRLRDSLLAAHRASPF